MGATEFLRSSSVSIEAMLYYRGYHEAKRVATPLRQPASGEHDGHRRGKPDYDHEGGQDDKQPAKGLRWWIWAVIKGP